MTQKPELPTIPGLDEVFVANRFVASAGGEMQDVICPADEEVIASVRMPSTEDADRAVAAARKAFDAGPWPRGWEARLCSPENRPPLFWA